MGTLKLLSVPLNQEVVDKFLHAVKEAGWGAKLGDDAKAAARGY